jgi:hypothetical protein
MEPDHTRTMLYDRALNLTNKLQAAIESIKKHERGELLPTPAEMGTGIDDRTAAVLGLVSEASSLLQNLTKSIIDNRLTVILSTLRKLQGIIGEIRVIELSRTNGH